MGPSEVPNRLDELLDNKRLNRDQKVLYSNFYFFNPFSARFWCIYPRKTQVSVFFPVKGVREWGRSETLRSEKNTVLLTSCSSFSLFLSSLPVLSPSSPCPFHPVIPARFYICIGLSPKSRPLLSVYRTVQKGRLRQNVSVCFSPLFSFYNLCLSFLFVSTLSTHAVLSLGHCLYCPFALRPK